MTIEITPDWQPVTHEELDALAPFTLHCQGLSDEAVATLKEEHRDALRRAVLGASSAVGRALNQEEAEMVAASVAAWFNDTVIPAKRERAEGEALH